MFYPAHINLQARRCLVVGGGTVAERKVAAMLLSGGEVTVISPEATALLAFLADTGAIRWHKRDLQTGDTAGYFLVSAATDETRINTAVFREAREHHKICLVNVVDVVPQCTFAAASVVTDGELIFSISTSGGSPATSRRIREYLERSLDARSIYTLGYENGEPTPIENRGAPYPAYLLLENRRCVVSYRELTPDMERRIALLNRCGASVVPVERTEMDAVPAEEAFLVISDAHRTADTACETDNTHLQEYLDAPDAGTHYTPECVSDGALLISVSAQNGGSTERGKTGLRELTTRFENRGYGAFVDFLSSRRSEILAAFPTPKKRADFFDRLIDNVDNVDSGGREAERCCLGLAPDAAGTCSPHAAGTCSAACLFNWVRQGELDRANAYTTSLLAAWTARGSD